MLPESANPRQSLKEAIEKTHNCQAYWMESVKVKEEFESQPAWEGNVEVFAITGHPNAGIAYAWGYRDVIENKPTIVLALPPVGSAEMAVKIAVATKAR